tara:strand:+ start:195 stop:452 length:258 start_codon:yes stop_codon:yes gene_type:complete
LIGLIPNLNKTLIGISKHNSSSVDIYFLPECPWSEIAIKLIDSFHIKYNSYVINNDEEFKQINNKTAIYIFLKIFINNQFIRGYP